MLLLSHISSDFINLFFIYSFLYLNFSSLYFQKKKIFFLLLPINSRTYCYTSSNLSISFLPLYLPTTLSLYFFPLFYIFFSIFKLFFSLFSKKKKKKLFFSLLVHAPTDTLLPTFPFLFCLFISPTTLPLYFLPLFYILTLFLPILFCINLISFSHSIHIFSIQNCEYSLSLSLYFLSVNFCSFL